MDVAKVKKETKNLGGRYRREKKGKTRKKVRPGKVLNGGMRLLVLIRGKKSRCSAGLNAHSVQSLALMIYCSVAYCFK